MSSLDLFHSSHLKRKLITKEMKRIKLEREILHLRRKLRSLHCESEKIRIRMRRKEARLQLLRMSGFFICVL